MNVVYSASDLYAPLTGISLTSLLINHTDVDQLHVAVLDNGISDGNKEKLRLTARSFGRDLRFVPLPSWIREKRVDVGKWNISTFGRLFEASSLPELDRVIHMDCDTVVDGSLKPLWDLDMSRAAIAGAPDCLSDAYKLDIGLKSTDVYLNAGLIVMNLARIRALRLEQKFMNYIEKNGRLLAYADQEVLNACIPAEEKIQLPLRYNSYTILHYLSYQQLKTLRHAEHMFSEEDYEDAVCRPVALHFTGCFLEGTRPWTEGDRHPRKAVFEKYKRQSQWAEMAAWRDRRPVRDKAASIGAKIVPKIILAPVAGYVHGVYVPRRNKTRRESMRWE